MSASLVGSEMCIRDSLHAHAQSVSRGLPLVSVDGRSVGFPQPLVDRKEQLGPRRMHARPARCSAQPGCSMAAKKIGVEATRHARMRDHAAIASQGEKRTSR
eukprot:15466779-Alexandrium_andersonii.AAC.1